eukprot:GEMP01084512.1.p1 GENE.GEMP01084512.1~~GEMP01084512.1.p1  ORF type:complete len:234 (+),score=68.74 GEMP01084512.1:119-820(+)
MRFGMFTIFVATLHGAEDTADDTDNVLERLTLTMGVDINNDLSFTVRDATLGKAILSLANVDVIVGKEEACKKMLAEQVSKQMIFWERVPDTEAAEKKIDDTTYQHIIADVWTLEGLHIGHHLSKSGCATIVNRTPNPNVAMSEPHIFATRADLQKAEKFEELRNLQKQMRIDAKADAKREAIEAEIRPMSISGSLSIVGVMLLVAAGLYNFGRGDRKRRRAKPSVVLKSKMT